MKLVKWTEIIFLASALLLSMTWMRLAFGEETATQKVEDASHDVAKDVRKTGRQVEDKTCALTNGKMVCAGKKVKHKVQNAVDDIKN